MPIVRFLLDVHKPLFRGNKGDFSLQVKKWPDTSVQLPDLFELNGDMAEDFPSEYGVVFRAESTLDEPLTKASVDGNTLHCSFGTATEPEAWTIIADGGTDYRTSSLVLTLEPA